MENAPDPRDPRNWYGPIDCLMLSSELILSLSYGLKVRETFCIRHCKKFDLADHVFHHVSYEFDL